MTALLAVSTLFDAIIEHRVVITFNTLYLSQVSFAVVIIAVSLALRRESLRVETELQLYRTHMDELVEARVRELDEAYSRLEYETEERRATEEVLRRRVEELDVLTRMAQILAGRTTPARGARRGDQRDVQSLQGALRPRAPAGGRRDRPKRRLTAPTSGAPITPLDLAVTDAVVSLGDMLTGEAADWPGLAEELRRRAQDEGIGPVLAEPLIGDLRRGRGARRRAGRGRERLLRRGTPARPHDRRVTGRDHRDRPPLPRGHAGRPPRRSARRWRATCTTP